MTSPVRLASPVRPHDEIRSARPRKSLLTHAMPAGFFRPFGADHIVGHLTTGKRG